MNDHDMDLNPQPPAPSPTDRMPVVPYRNMEPRMFPAVNRDLGLQLNEDQHRRIQAHFRSAEGRDPTVGELRLLDALDRIGRRCPDRMAVGELITDRECIMETWADMMDKHHRLLPGDTPPCTLPGALFLTETYLSRTGRRSAPVGEEAVRVVADRADVAQALAEGYATVCRLTLGDGVDTRQVLYRPAERAGKRRADAPVREGDLFLLLGGVASDRLEAFFATAGVSAMVADARPLTVHSLLLDTLGMAPGAELNLDRLVPPAQEGGESAITAFLALSDRLVQETDGQSLGYLILRVSGTHIKPLWGILEQCDLAGHAVVYGRALRAARVVLSSGGVTSVSLSADAVRGAQAMYLHSFRLPSVASDAPLPTVTACHTSDEELLTLQTPLTPLAPSATVDLLVSAASVTVKCPEDDAYTAAMNTVQAAIADPLERGADPRTLSLSVRLTVANERPTATALAMICGLYRAAAELSLPMPHPAIELSPGRTGDGVFLSVCAYAPVDARQPNDPLTNTHIHVILKSQHSKGENVS